jgi:hypothetical protein
MKRKKRSKEEYRGAFGLDQPAFDEQAFLNGLANLDADGPFNASNGFNY